MNVLRRKPLKKAPGISEAVEWAQASASGYQEYHEDCVLDGLSILASIKRMKGLLPRGADRHEGVGIMERLL